MFIRNSKITVHNVLHVLHVLHVFLCFHFSFLFFRKLELWPRLVARQKGLVLSPCKGGLSWTATLRLRLAIWSLAGAPLPVGRFRFFSGYMMKTKGENQMRTFSVDFVRWILPFRSYRKLKQVFDCLIGIVEIDCLASISISLTMLSHCCILDNNLPIHHCLGFSNIASGQPTSSVTWFNWIRSMVEDVKDSPWPECLVRPQAEVLLHPQIAKSPDLQQFRHLLCSFVTFLPLRSPKTACLELVFAASKAQALGQPMATAPSPPSGVPGLLDTIVFWRISNIQA